MGQQQSIELQKISKPGIPHIKDVMNVLDQIASSYIFTPSFTDMLKLDKKEYCDELVILTSKAISNSFNKTQVNITNERIQRGIDDTEAYVKENVIYFNKNNLDKFNTKNDLTRVKICKSIAKFYVKCAHVYSAITKTVNPLYQYKDKYGKLIYEPNKRKIPPGVDYSVVYFNYCSRRLSSVYFNNNKPIKLYDLYIKSSKIEKLLHEFDIEHLEQLYYDIYNKDTNSYDIMSDDSKRQYEIDVNMLNRAMTGSKSSSVKSFEDITFPKSTSINFDTFNDSISINKSDFEQYSIALTTMNDDINENQLRIIEHLNTLCLKYIDNTGEEQYKLHPDLTEDSLNNLIINVRTDIINFYLKCQTNFNNIKDVLFKIIVKKLEKRFLRQEQQLRHLIDSI